MKEEEKIIIKYSVECPECKKKISGTAPSQVKYNLKVHLRQKHNQDLNKKEESK